MSEPGRRDRIWVLAAPPDAFAPLRALIQARERQGPVRLVQVSGKVRSADAWSKELANAAGILVVGDRRHSPRDSLPGPFLRDGNGRLVPAGWLPNAGSEALERFARAAACVLLRDPRQVGPLALLAQWQFQYLYLAERMEANLRRGHRPSFRILRWTAERITREAVASALGVGLGLAIYFGHGRPTGWAGYHGMRARHLIAGSEAPLGALFSATCFTASRWRVRMSFSEAVVLGGVAASSVGAVTHVNHVENMRWMLGLADALGAGEFVLGQVMQRAALQDSRAENLYRVYRIIGDPLAPLVGTPVGKRRAPRVAAPAPDEWRKD